MSFIENEDQTLIAQVNYQYQNSSKNVLQALQNEANILYKGLTNQEYLEYCFVKGACGQTIPLALLVPVGLVLGIINIIGRGILNIMDGDSILITIVQGILQVAALSIVLYLILKACEVIPKKINNPLLVGRVTTYLFMCLLVTEGILVVERITQNTSRSYHTSQFWVVFALVIWQKVLQLFIYDFKIRIVCFSFLYLYYAFRVSGEDMKWSYNLLKTSIYISLEAIMAIDTELKNYSQYQMENNMQQRVNNVDGDQVQFMVPPVSMFAQQLILEKLSNVFPVAIFDQNKELLHLSGVTFNQFGLVFEQDLTAAEVKLRKAEILTIFDKKEKDEIKLKRLQKQAKFGSTCGVNENGDLLHSLIHGPALQQLRQQFQPEVPRYINYTNEGILEQQLNEILKNDLNSIQGVLQCKIEKDKLKQFKFHLIKQNNYIYMLMDDVTKIWQQPKQDENITDLTDLKNICKEIRQTIKEDVPYSIQNTEIKICLLEQSSIRVNYNEIDPNQIVEELQKIYKDQITEIKFGIKSTFKCNNQFYNDLSRIYQIVDNLLQNSIKHTDEGFITILIQNDIRPNCMQIIIEDTGDGIKKEILKGNIFNTLQVTNYMVKMLGPISYNNKIKGNIANQGLKIVTAEGCGCKMIFTLRNMGNDTTQMHYLIDEDSIDELDLGQDDLMERYLGEEENYQYLPRLNKAIKFQVLKIVEEIKEIKQQQVQSRRQPKLAGMMKLQESGRLKQIQNKFQQSDSSQCTCSGKLLINSRYQFKVEDYLMVNEQEAFKTINLKIKESQCQGCLGYAKILINCCRNDYDYQEQQFQIYFQINYQITLIEQKSENNSTSIYYMWRMEQQYLMYYYAKYQMDRLNKMNYIQQQLWKTRCQNPFIFISMKWILNLKDMLNQPINQQSSLLLYLLDINNIIDSLICDCILFGEIFNLCLLNHWGQCFLYSIICSCMAYVEEATTELVESVEQMNQLKCIQIILIHLIEQYHKTPQEEALLFTSKLNSIMQIDKRYNKSEINQNYIFPRQEIAEVAPETPQNNFKDLLTKIYVTSQKKVQTQAQLKQELLKKSYSIFQQKKPLIKSTKNSTLKLQQSLSQVRMHTDMSIKQPSQKQSRGQSPDMKLPNTNRSISTQLMKFVNQKKKEIQLFNGCKSFESRQKFNRSPQLLQNKSYDFSKNINKLK